MFSTVKALLVAESITLTTSEWDSIQKAIAYHDVVTGPNHETASAALCYAETGDALACYWIITGTIHFGNEWTAWKLFEEILGLGDQLAIKADLETLTNVTKVIHDADLWNLALDEPYYSKAQDRVMLENFALQHSPEDIYKGRLRFLDWCIARVEENNLFYTNEGKKLHFKVHANVTKEKQRIMKT
jgi:hypothetical protein